MATITTTLLTFANTTQFHLPSTNQNNKQQHHHFQVQPFSFSKFQCLSNTFLSSHFKYIGTQNLNNNYVISSCLHSSSSSLNTTTTRLYVSGLSFRTTRESLKNAFQQFGQLVEVNLVMDRIANRPRGFAFLRYENEEESKKAIEGMHGKFLDGRVIFVEVAKPKSEAQKNKQDTR